MRRPYRRLMSKLAFLAMALLCLMPTISRLTATTSTGRSVAPALMVAAPSAHEHATHDHHSVPATVAAPSHVHDHHSMQGLATAVATVSTPSTPAPSSQGDEHANHGEHGRGDEHGKHGTGGPDCEYCPLLASLLTQAVFEPAPRLLHVEVRTQGLRASAFLPTPMVPSLGSRGPPTAA